MASVTKIAFLLNLLITFQLIFFQFQSSASSSSSHLAASSNHKCSPPPPPPPPPRKDTSCDPYDGYDDDHHHHHKCPPPPPPPQSSCPFAGNANFTACSHSLDPGVPPIPGDSANLTQPFFDYCCFDILENLNNPDGSVDVSHATACLCDAFKSSPLALSPGFRQILNTGFHECLGFDLPSNFTCQPSPPAPTPSLIPPGIL